MADIIAYLYISRIESSKIKKTEAVKNLKEFKKQSYIKIIPDRKKITIGRNLKSDVYVSHPLISNNHCYLFNDDDTLKLVDSGSSNGTYYNKAKIDEKILEVDVRHHILLAHSIQLEIVYTSEKTEIIPFRGRFSPAILENKHIGDIYLQKKIETGNTSYIYDAMQTGLQRKVAVKILNKSFGREEKAARRFRRFTRLASTLSHPSLLSIYNSGIHTFEYDNKEYNIFFIAMEYINGNSLAQILSKQKRIDFGEVCNIMLQVADCIAYLHENRIMHRNLAPSNIVLQENGMAKVIGIRLLKKLNETDTRMLTVTGMAMGVMGYASPEELMGQKADERSDIYSLGAIFYHCLSGEPPYKTDSDIFALIDNLKKGIHVASLLSRNVPVPKKLNDIIMKCLQHKKEDRYESVAQLISELSSVIQRDRELIHNFFGLFPPHHYSTNRVHLQTFYKPCENVGGDFYTYLEHENRIFFVVGDVSGHGTPASIVVALMIGFINILAKYKKQPLEIFQELHMRAYPCLTSSTYVEAMCGVIDFTTRQLTICQAGRTPVIIFNPQREDRFAVYQNPGTAIGMIPKFLGNETVIDLENGDHILSCTDGVFEVHDSKCEKDGLEEYGLDRLGNILEQSNDNTLEQIHQNIYQDIQKFAEIDDDITIMSIKPKWEE